MTSIRYFQAEHYSVLFSPGLSLFNKITHSLFNFESLEVVITATLSLKYISPYLTVRRPVPLLLVLVADLIMAVVSSC